MNKGLVSVTFRKKTPEEVIDIVKKSGLTHIEWGGDVHVPHGDVETAKRVGELTRAPGLTVSSYGSYFRDPAADLQFEDVLASAIALQTDIIRVWAGKKNFDIATDEEKQAVYAMLTRAVKLAAEHNITVATEYHQNTLTNTLEGTLELLKNVPGLKTYWQPAPVSVEESCEAIRTLGKNIVNVHMNYSVDWEINPLKEGAESIRCFMQALRQYSDAKSVMLEFVKDGTDQQFLEDAEVLLSL